jgi:hypothetical protein
MYKLNGYKTIPGVRLQYITSGHYSPGRDAMKLRGMCNKITPFKRRWSTKIEVFWPFKPKEAYFRVYT